MDGTFIGLGSNVVEYCDHPKSGHYLERPDLVGFGRTRMEEHREDWAFIQETVKDETATAVMICLNCLNLTPTWMRRKEELIARANRRAEYEAQRKAEMAEEAESLMVPWYCSGCESVSEMSDAIQIRYCTHCERSFSGTDYGRNCEECNRPFTRKVTDQGCPNCENDYDEDDDGRFEPWEDVS